MKRTLSTLAFAFAAVASFAAATSDLKPQPHYGEVARRELNMLAGYHVLQRPVDEAASRQAWTNLFNSYDASHCIFLKGDIARYENLQTTIADRLRRGDVSFAYELHALFTRRVTECIEYATNLVTYGRFDYTVKEDYCWDRKDAAWPADESERRELWRLRVKNELLSQILGRELDAEQERKDEAARKRKDAKSKDKDKDKDKDDWVEPKLPPNENLVKRYRQYLLLMTEPDEETVLQRLLSAVARSYDPHSDYMCPMNKEDFDMEMNLSLFGVGATLQMDADTGGLKITELISGGPLARQGRIKKGDRIVGVGQGDGPVEDVLYKPMKKTIKKIRGKKGTKVVLEILPRGKSVGTATQRHAIIRDEIKLEDRAVTGRVETVVLDGVTNLVGYVKLPEFYGTMDRKPGQPGYRSCSYDVARYVAQFNSRSADAMVLDLRGNGGGSLREAVLLTALFTRPAPVVQIRETRQLYVLPTFPDQPTLAWRKPLVVLVNRLSASASEIVAGALQDLGRAVIIGDTQTHGKGTVQTVMPLGAQKFGSTKITTARFYRINGSSTQVKGVSSDIVLPSILDGLDLGEDKLPNALPWTRIEPAAHERIWNMPDLVSGLKRASDQRLAKDEQWQRHARAVELFRENAKRKTAPLERVARLKQMREERDMRKLEDAEYGDDDESAEEGALADGVDDAAKTTRDDVVLRASLDIVADIVRATGGAEVPKEEEPKTPAWLKSLGVQ